MCAYPGMRLNRRRLVLVPFMILVLGIVASYFLPPQVRFIPLITSILLMMLYYVRLVLRTKITYSIVDEDLLYLVTHMYAVSTGKPPKSRLFKLKTIVGGYEEYDYYLRRIASLAVDWGFSFARAITIVAREIKNKVFRDFLTRLGEILNVGEDPERYLDVERRAVFMEFQAQYGRSLESMKLLLGTYTSTISSSMFLTITVIIYTLLMGGDPTTVVYTYMGVIVALAGVLYVIYRILPRDRLTHKLGIYPPQRTRYRRILIMSITLVIVMTFVYYNLLHDIQLAIGAAAILLIFPGLYARRIESFIKELNTFFSVFIRSFGITYSVVSHTPKALASVLRSNFGPLTPYLRRLYNRLRVGVRPDIAWRYFTGETWSELIRRSVNVVYDTIEAGGNMAVIGTILSDMSFRLQDLKKQREQIARAFEATVYILHLIMVAVTTFILELVRIFNTMIEAILRVAPGITVTILPFGYVDVTLLTYLTTILIIATAIMNAIAIRVARGGMYETVWVQISILTSFSMLTAMAIKTATAFLFEELLGFTRLIETTS